MVTENPQPLLNLLLSNEELAFLVRLLEVEYFPGLEGDPLGELQKKEAALLLGFIERALRARELARIQDDGHLVVHEVLLRAVAVCGYPQRSIYLHHFPVEGIPERYFGHCREDLAVAHTSPEAGLHLLSVLPEKEVLIDQILQFSKCYQSPKTEIQSITITGKALKQVQEIAQEENTSSLREKLLHYGADEESAQIMSKALVAPYDLSVFHHVVPTENGKGSKEEISVLQIDEIALLLSPVDTQETENENYLLSPVTTAELSNLFRQWIGKK